MELKFILESLLFSAQKPLSLKELRDVFANAAELDGADATVKSLKKTKESDLVVALEQLAKEHEEAKRSYRLVCVAGAWQFVTEGEFSPWLRALVGVKARPPRLSQPALETLAIIAYRQPITRAEIEQIRGVGVASSIVKTLEEREWVRVVGYRDLPGKPALFGTTKAFLDYFNLKSLDQLPPLSEIREIEDLDPQLSLGGPETPRAPDESDADDGDGTDTHGDTPHPGQHAPDPTTDEDAHADEKMRDNTPEPAA
jgi:segregation and condensation protein B